MGTGGLQTKLFFLETLYWTDLYHLQGLHTSSSSALWLLVLITHPEKKKKQNTPSDGTVPCETVWPQALLPGREGMERGPLSPRPHLPY